MTERRMTVLHIAAPLGGLAVALLLLSGCESADADFGHSIRHNQAVQTVEARPVYAGLPTEGSDGVRGADAQRRYLTGKVKDLLKVDGKSGLGAQGGATDSAAAGSGRTAAP
jgi:hypothetical protein